jgi:hypothetical protein
MNRSFFFAVLILFAALTVFGQNQNTSEDDTTIVPFQFKSPRANGMGGIHAALADDFDTIFVNPAGFATAKNQFSAAAINATFHDIDTVLRMASSNFSDPAQYIALLKNYFEAGVDFGGPLAIGLIKGNWGLGLMNNQYLKIWWDRNNIFVLNANVVEEIVFFAGQSFPIPNFEQTVTFTPGYAVKPAVRFVYAPRDVQYIDFRYILQNLQDQPFETHFIFGVDAGFLLSFYDTLYFAGVCRDLFTPVQVRRYEDYSAFTDNPGQAAPSVEFVKPVYDFSICFRTINTFVYDVVEDIVFTVDYHDVGSFFENTGRDPFLNIGAGIELRLLRALRFRAGWQQMLPGGGFGIDLGWVTIDAAVYGETFGNQQDDYRRVSLSFGLAFRY